MTIIIPFKYSLSSMDYSFLLISFHSRFFQSLQKDSAPLQLAVQWNKIQFCSEVFRTSHVETVALWSSECTLKSTTLVTHAAEGEISTSKQQNRPVLPPTGLLENCIFLGWALDGEKAVKWQRRKYDLQNYTTIFWVF